MFTKYNYLIKEHVALLKVTDKYDVIDPETGEVVAYAQENIPIWTKVLRFLINKKWLPAKVEICDSKTDQVQFVMKRPVTFFRSIVNIYDSNNNSMGYFKSRILTLGGRFDIFGSDGRKVANVKGNWTGWNFSMTTEDGKEIGTVSKKWAGLGKELFTTADNYMIALNPSISNTQMIPLLLMAGLAIDIVYNEKR